VHPRQKILDMHMRKGSPPYVGTGPQAEEGRADEGGERSGGNPRVFLYNFLE